jgi:threonylcarbamoyladenosine tRNA methylthiotransferase MtaB
MGRKYDTYTVHKATLSLRQWFPDCGITADLIVGFPGETNAEFEQTLEFIKTAMFSGMHIFQFSPRPGTRAADMPDQVAKMIKHKRAQDAALTCKELAYTFRRSQIGKTAEVLFEHKRGGYWTGHSGNYLEITARNGGEKNNMYTVKITSIENGIIWGEII